MSSAQVVKAILGSLKDPRSQAKGKNEGLKDVSERKIGFIEYRK